MRNSELSLQKKPHLVASLYFGGGKILGWGRDRETTCDNPQMSIHIVDFLCKILENQEAMITLLSACLVSPLGYNLLEAILTFLL